MAEVTRVIDGLNANTVQLCQVQYEETMLL